MLSAGINVEFETWAGTEELKKVLLKKSHEAVPPVNTQPPIMQGFTGVDHCFSAVFAPQ